MLNHNHKNQVCAYAESLVAYLYDEAGAAERIAFEAHLDNCASCADELAEIGFARTAVYEWRVADFDVLPTPIFEIPMRAVQATTATEKSAPWFDGWQRIFSLKPALAMSSLVVLVAFFGIAAFVFNFKTDAPLVENVQEKELTKTTVSPTVEKSANESKDAVVAKTPEISASEISNPTLKTDERKSATIKNAPVKISTGAPKISPAKAVQKDFKRPPKTNDAAKSDVPRLTETDDEEDDSIRLADLFDEIGTE